MLKKFLIFLILMGAFTLNAQEKYALLIGINDYQSTKIRDLNYCEADAHYLKDMLFRYARFKEKNIKMLLGRDANYSNIKSEIYRLGNMASKNDLVFFYFGGHGTRVPDTDDNEEDGLDEAFCPYDTEISNTATVILDDEIGHWFGRIKAEKIVVVLDCCHSGGAAGRALENDDSKGLDMAATSTARGLLSPDVDLYARDLAIDNKFIMTAAAANEQSYENPELGHGVFTYYVGEAIRGNADFDNNQFITTGEMYEYTKTKTLEFAKSINRKQTPVRFGSLEDAVITQISKQIADIKLFDPDLRSVYLNIGGDLVKEGDFFIIKKNMQRGARDLEVADQDIFKVEIIKIQDSYSEAKIIEEYYKVNMDSSSYGDYYAEKLAFGSIYIHTIPWSTVYLDGKEIGPTPLVITQVTEGDHTLEFKTDILGYPHRVNKTIKVEGDKKLRIVEKFAKK